MEREPTAIRDITRRYYAIWWSYALANGVLFGVYPLFLRARGLDQFQINSVLATYFAVSLLTDLPTGAFADAIGRRGAFLLGCLVRSSAFLVYFFAHTWRVFLVAECIDGLGTTFCNGAIDAWGVDALDAAGFQGMKDRLFSRIAQITNGAFMMAAVIGAYIADLDIAWPWILGAAGYLVSAAVAARLMRGGRRGGGSIDGVTLRSLMTARVRDGLRQGFGRRPLFLLSLAGAIQVAAWAPYWLEWPQFFVDSYGVGVWIIGWIYSALTAARLLGAEAVNRAAVGASTRAGLLATLVASASALLFAAGLASGHATAVLLLLFACNLCTGAMQPLMQTWFNEHIRADERATMLSFGSTLATLGGAVGLLLGGWVADVAGVPVAWRIAGLLSLPAAACYWALREPASRSPRVAVAD
jgi:MFS family permease